MFGASVVQGAAKARTTTSLTVSKSEDCIITLKAKVQPVHPKIKVTFTLFEKYKGDWATFLTKKVGYSASAGAYKFTTDQDSWYGTWKAKAKFPGDADHKASSASKVFECEAGSGGGGSGGGGSNNGIPSCRDAPPAFTVVPIRSDDYTHIHPLGEISATGGGHLFPTDHVYFGLQQDGEPGPYGSPRIVPFFSPGTATMTSGATLEFNLGKESEYTEYRVDLTACEGKKGPIVVQMGHVGPLSNRLENVFENNEPVSCEITDGNDGVSRDRYCRWDDLSLPVEPGEQLGFTSGKAAAFDLHAYDWNADPLYFINPARVDIAGLQTICPADLFVGEARAEMYSRFGAVATSDSGPVHRTIEPICGSINQDIAGRAQGNWYVPGTPEEPGQHYLHLALVRDNTDPRIPVFSIGASVQGLSPGAYYYTSSSNGLVNRDFPDISADGNIYCFEQMRKKFLVPTSETIILKMPTNTTLRIEGRTENSCGTGPWTFTDEAASFQR